MVKGLGSIMMRKTQQYRGSSGGLFTSEWFRKQWGMMHADASLFFLFFPYKQSQSTAPAMALGAFS